MSEYERIDDRQRNVGFVGDATTSYGSSSNVNLDNYYNKDEIDSRFISKYGGHMIGSLEISGDLQCNNQLLLETSDVKEITRESVTIEDSIKINCENETGVQISGSQDYINCDDKFVVNNDGSITSDQITTINNQITDLQNVDHTEDHYDKTEVDTLLDEKVDTTTLSSNYLTSSDILDVDDENIETGLLASYVKTTDFESEIQNKVNITDMNSALDQKANTSDVNAALDLKANSSDVYTKTEIIDTSGETETGILSEYAKKSEIGTVNLGNTTYNETLGVVFEDTINIREKDINFLRPDDDTTAGYIQYQEEGMKLGETRGGDLCELQIGSASIICSTNRESRLVVDQSGDVAINQNLNVGGLISGETIDTIDSKIENLELLMNEVRDTTTNYEFSTVTEGVDQTTTYDPVTNLNQSSTNKIYNVQNVSDNDSTSYCEVDQYEYYDNGTYARTTGFDSYVGEIIDIELPVTLDISSINILNASSNETVTKSKRIDGQYQGSTTNVSISKNEFYAKKIGVFGDDNGSWSFITTINNTDSGTSQSISGASYSKLRFLIEEINTIEYTYTISGNWYTADTTYTDYLKNNAYISGIEISGTTTENITAYQTKSAIGIQKLQTESSLNFENNSIEVDNINNRVNINNVLYFPNQVELPEKVDGRTDGALYRYNGQFELMVDDNFYIRDHDTTSTRNPEFLFSTNEGVAIYKGRNCTRDGNSYGFRYQNDDTFDRFRVYQFADGSGGYFWYNQDNLHGNSSDRRIKENIEDLEQSDIDFLLKIRPRKFKLKNSKRGYQYGMIAQEIIENISTIHQKSIVNHYEEYMEDENTEEILGLSYTSFIPLLIQLCQQQEEKIKELEEEKEVTHEKLEEIKTLVSENTIPTSETKDLLLHSDSIAMLESLDVYKDGLEVEKSSKEILLNLISLNQYLLKELHKIKLYLKNL